MLEYPTGAMVGFVAFAVLTRRCSRSSAVTLPTVDAADPAATSGARTSTRIEQTEI